MLFWNFNPPNTTESDQVFYKKELPTKDFGMVNVKISDIPTGKYQLNVYQVGYQVNDVYTDFIRMGSLNHLSREQVKDLATHNDGKPVETLKIQINHNNTFIKKINLRENDVFMICLEKLK